MPPAPGLPPQWSVDSLTDTLRIRCGVDDRAPSLADAGWHLRHVEDDLQRTVRVQPASVLPGTLRERAWSADVADGAYAAYVASFRDRPGFPGWSRARWLEWATGYSSFRPDLSRVITEEESVVAYALAALEPDACWIVQMGVVPARRRRGLGRTLLRSVGAAASGAGADALRLSVNVDNPAARTLYEAEGFTFFARRAVYERRP